MNDNNLIWEKYINEDYNRNCTISIDIQPEYQNYCNKIMNNFVNFLNTYKGDVYYFYNGSDLGIQDNPNSISHWLLEHGVEEEALNKIIFKEKTYGFFRNFMDLGMDRNDIIKIIRYMVMNQIYDSRDIEEENWISILGDNYKRFERIINSDSINLPDISIGHLKTLSGCYLIGGGKDQCLSEFRFLLEAFNIKYKLINSLIY